VYQKKVFTFAAYAVIQGASLTLEFEGCHDRLPSSPSTWFSICRRALDAAAALSHSPKAIVPPASHERATL
jgi:hypothetical protein